MAVNIVIKMWKLTTILVIFVNEGYFAFGSENIKKFAAIVEIGEELSKDGVLTSRQTMLRVNIKPKLQFYEEIEKRANVNTKMEMFTDGSFTTRLSNENQKEKSIAHFRNVFYQISLENYFEGAQIHLRTCWATPTMNATDKLRYNILQDGCSEDDTFLLYKSNSPTVARFSVKSFRFVASKLPTFYMHCKVDICDSVNPRPCFQGCSDIRKKRSSLKENDVRSKLDNENQSGLLLNVVCHPTKMVASITKPARESQVFYQLNDPSCIGKETETHITFETNLNECGSILHKSSRSLVYKNTIKEQPTSIIIRHNPINIPFQCSYNQQSTSKQIKIKLRPPKIGIKGIGIMPYKVNIDMFTDDTYTRKFTESIVEVDPNMFIYFQVRIDSQHFKLALFLDRCFGLPQPYFSTNEMYTFIKEGCATDRTVKFYNSPNLNLKRFRMKPFVFGQVVSQVLINCHVTPCNMYSKNTVCSKGCVKTQI